MKTIEDGKCLFEKELKQALTLTQKEMAEDPGEAWPRALCFHGDDKLDYMAIDPTFMNNPLDKNKIAATLVKKCFEPTMKCVIFLSDGLMARLPEGESFDSMPSNFAHWPKEYIHEAVLITINAAGMQGVSVKFPYTRDAQNNRIFVDAPDWEHLSTTNRFCFKLEGVQERTAIISALTSKIRVNTDAV